MPGAIERARRLASTMAQVFDPSKIRPVLATLAAVTIAYLITTTFLSYRKLRHFPGPRLAAFSQLWLFNVTSKGNLYLAAERVLRKYGSGTDYDESSRLTWFARLSGSHWT
jgi:hypothetical protein